MNKRAIVVIIDSLGVGYMDDVKEVRPQDIGANTFKHILDKSEDLKIPTLERLGINSILNHNKLEKREPIASYGVLNLMHEGADSYAGHQEIMGTRPKKPSKDPFRVYLPKVKEALINEGFKVVIPEEDKPYLLVEDLVVVADNIETDYGQIYNITAPLDYIEFEKVLEIAAVVRENVKVNRIIALGGSEVTIEDIINSIEVREDGLIGVNSPGSGVYDKGYNVRHIGYGVDPNAQVSTILTKSGKEVVLIGKMQDVIECEGSIKYPAIETEKVMKLIVENMDSVKEGLIAATVQETDLSGHSQDVDRYARKIMIVDKYLGKIMDKMSEEDILIVSADHGNDPTIGHSQHTREKTPLLIYSKLGKSKNIGERETLSDIGTTVSEFFNVDKPENGKNVL